ncbi:MAG: acetylxylan esterase [Spirochaetes bacterium]|nr:acetylxylan esterase [Spirochaetota bacterium]
MNTHNERTQLYRLMGDLPPRDRPVSAEVISAEQHGYVLEHLRLDLNGEDPVTALFAKPLNVKGHVPAVLYNHAHGGNFKLGKDELLNGCPPYITTPYIDDIIERGWAVLAIDHWVFGERGGRKQDDVFKEMLWKGQVLWGMMVYDSLRAVDYLGSRDDVDASRIATVGLSMGSTMAWWTAALDERIAACVDICCLTDFHALIETDGLSGHGCYYYVPNLLKHFTTTDINALIIPRPHLSLAGLKDTLTPVSGLDRIDVGLTQSYTEAGVPERWKLIREDVGHVETPTMRAAVLTFLEKYIGRV